MRPFRCLVTILNTLDPLGKFDGKDDEGFLVGYSVNSKAFRVFNSKTIIIQETLHINFLENQPNVAGSGPIWLFYIDTLTQSMNYQPVVAGNQPNHSAYADAAFDVKDNENEVHVSLSSSEKLKKHNDKAKREAKGKSFVDLSTGVRYLRDEFEEFSISSTNRANAVSTPVTATGSNPTNRTNSFNAANMPTLEDIVYSDDEEDVGAEANFSNLETNISVNPIPTTSVYKYHIVSQIIGELITAHQTRSMARIVKEQGGLNQINEEKGDILLVRVYVDDIIFGSTNKELCKAFEKLMKDKFQMSSMEELTFFLRLQVKQKNDGIFISQDKYVAEILRNFSITYGKSASTPIDTEKPLLKDLDGEDVDIHIYRYLKGKLHWGMWYPKDSPFNSVAYSDSDYVGASLDRKSTTGGCQFPSYRLIYWQFKKQTVVATSLTKVEYIAAYGVIGMKFACHKCFKCWLKHHTSNGYQFTMSNPHQELTSPDQTVSGKDSSNLLMADNLPKIVWHFITAVSYKLMMFCLTKVVVHLMLLDDADGVECLPTEEIFAKLARMGYKKPPPKLTFYKAFFSA
nr:hypothetical protein [Tanacetum cinerariifolium]